MGSFRLETDPTRALSQTLSDQVPTRWIDGSTR